MRIKQFKEIDKKQRIIWIVGISIMLFITIALIYRTYAIYEENQEFNAIKGSIPNQDYDLKLSYTITDESGNIKAVENPPTDKNYKVSISCNNNAIGEWNYESWGPDIRNLKNTFTKCKINFSKDKPLVAYGIQESLANSNSGLYVVGHNNAMISFRNETEKNNLTKEEYRYAGNSPKNYVKFNNELWRIIGLVNTIEGQRIKIMRNEPIGKYSWDSSEQTINHGDGVNEWSRADLMTLLNSGSYYNRNSGTCYVAYCNQMETCNFTSSGLLNDSKEMIDTITWNTGSQGNLPIEEFSPIHMYGVERSSSSGKMNCNSDSNYCNDKVIRTDRWAGKIALPYPSDYGYATASDNISDRENCLNTSLTNWSGNEKCYNNNWIYHNNYKIWLLTPYSDYQPTSATYIYQINSNGNIGPSHASNGTMSNRFNSVFPSLYLKQNVKIVNGEGTQNLPYELSLQ